MSLKSLGSMYTTVHTVRQTDTRASLQTKATGAPHMIAAIVLPPKFASTINAQPWKSARAHSRERTHRSDASE
jgi:hypothetical protein